MSSPYARTIKSHVAPKDISSEVFSHILRCAIRYAIQSRSAIGWKLPKLLTDELLTHCTISDLSEIFSDVDRGLLLPYTDEKQPPLVRKAWVDLRDHMAELISDLNQPLRGSSIVNRQLKRRHRRRPAVDEDP